MRLLKGPSGMASTFSLAECTVGVRCYGGGAAGEAELPRMTEFRILMRAIYIIGLGIQNAWEESELERVVRTEY